jgi:predicted nucleic acid-binding protein
MAKKRAKVESTKSYFCDASFLIAYFATEDQYHAKALNIRKKLGQKPVKLVTCWPILSEAGTVLLYHYGYSHAVALLQSLQAFEMILPHEAEYNEAISLFKKWNQDNKFSLNDLLVYVLLRDQCKNTQLLSFDHDFRKMGLPVFRD